MKRSDVEQKIETARTCLFPNYRPYPLILERGEDCRVWDSEGREYVDFVAGIATCNLGHCHPTVTEAIRSQAETLLHVSNWYYNIPQMELAKRLTGLTSMDRVFFCNSGAEAAEAAIKVARKKTFEEHGPGKNTVISLKGAFHGRTMKALTATDPKQHLEAFSPYPDGFVHIEAGDIQGLKDHLPVACAFFMEPIQGEGGVRPVDPGFIREAADLCLENDVLLMMDEVQTGVGRCGTLFAYELSGIKPDIITLAKGLGNGFPIGAVLASEQAASHLGPGSHGSTFGGNPLACSAALATINTVVEEDLPHRAEKMGAIFVKGLKDLVNLTSAALEVRGAGLLLGLELNIKAAPVVQQLIQLGYLTTVVQDHTLRFTPPLTVTEEDIHGLIDALRKTLLSQGGSS
ncbi:aspartate aminotransferase family protein [bacterium]|nr:MAG: aspartate aminotransferase family protein [bacterium]